MDNMITSRDTENIPVIRDKQHDEAGDDEHKQDTAHDTSEHSEVYLGLNMKIFSNNVY